MSQLKNSGYSRKQAKEVVVCGVVGWRRKRQKRGQNQYLEARETLEQRTNDKLLEKTNWYRPTRKGKQKTMKASSSTTHH